MYGADSGTNLPTQGYSYAQIGTGVLVGWYGSRGVWGIDKKVELQYAWINTVDDVTTATFAFYNQDSTASAEKTFYVGVYE